VARPLLPPGLLLERRLSAGFFSGGRDLRRRKRAAVVYVGEVAIVDSPAAFVRTIADPRERGSANFRGMGPN